MFNNYLAKLKSSLLCKHPQLPAHHPYPKVLWCLPCETPALWTHLYLLFPSAHIADPGENIRHPSRPLWLWFHGHKPRIGPALPHSPPMLPGQFAPQLSEQFFHISSLIIPLPLSYNSWRRTSSHLQLGKQQLARSSLRSSPTSS